MYRLSSYNIYLAMKKGKFLLVQGMYGSFDVVDKAIYDSIIFCRDENNGAIIEERFDENVLVSLKKRGYITCLDQEEEHTKFKKISDIISTKKNNDLSLTIIPTYNCNFRCEYCFEKKIQDMGAKVLGSTMTPEIVDAVFRYVDKIKAEGRNLHDICFFGGEPFLKNNYKIVEYVCEKAAERDIRLSCITNGYDLEHYIELIKNNNFSSVQITLDGVGEAHDQRRFLAGGKGSFDKITENVELALKNGINIFLRTNVNKKNVSEIKKLIAYYCEKGWINYSNFNYYFKATHKCYELLENQYSDLELMGEIISACAENNIEFDRKHLNSQYFLISDSIRNMIKEHTFAAINNVYCRAGFNMFVVDPFKNIYACWDSAGEEHKIIGTIDTENAEFVFNDNYKRWSERNVGNIEKCSRCTYAFFCGGGCAAHANIVNGSIFTGLCDEFQEIFNKVAVDVCSEFVD
ncbi:radical SAM/SPASM domain-containing protein [Ruminococcus flavefaciens]|uniref:radical SAM/SPASM domain-containing protein n=1 Tax=Ruminococcus flavefaciens TaxID=1265 RepID=UPI000491737E|nr:radical SAM protein [Ruminococcus flavefaciens]